MGRYLTLPWFWFFTLFVYGILMSALDEENKLVPIFVIFSLISACISFIYVKENKGIFRFLLPIGVVVSGYVHSESAYYKRNHIIAVIDQNLDQKQRIKGYIVSRKQRENDYEYLMQVTENPITPNGYGYKIFIRSAENLSAGEVYEVFSRKMYKIKTLENPYSFDYSAYLKRIKILGRVYPTQINTAKTTKDPIKRWSLRSRSIIEQRLVREFKQPTTATIFIAMVLGNKEDLAPDQRQAFTASGLSHILAVSGLHLGIVFSMIFAMIWLLRYLFRIYDKRLYLLAIPILVLFVFVTGLSPSAVRAMFMIALWLIFRYGLRWNVKPLEIVLFSAVLMLFIQPTVLFSISYLLSFSAVMGISLHYGTFYKIIHRRNYILQYIFGTIFISLICTFYTLPWVVGFFHSVSFMGVLTSVLGILAANLILGLAPLLLIPELGIVVARIEESIIHFLNQMTNQLTDNWLYIENLHFNCASLLCFFACSVLILLSISRPKVVYILSSILLLILGFNLEMIYRRNFLNQPHLVIYDMYNQPQVDIIANDQVIRFSSNPYENDDMLKRMGINLSKKYRLSEPNKILINGARIEVVINEDSILVNGQMVYNKDSQGKIMTINGL